jgi:hypothetical protein
MLKYIQGRFQTVAQSIATVVTTVFKTVAKCCCDTQILDGLRNVADVLLQQFQLSQIAILTVAKAQFSCSVCICSHIYRFSNLAILKYKIFF